MNDKVRIGIAGTGYTIGIANSHVKGYMANPNAQLVALYDILPGRAQKWAMEKGLTDVIICNTYDELLDKVDAVSICTPNYSHVPLIIRALEAGKHVLCEKPISTSYQEGKEAVKYAKCSGLVNMIGFSYRGIPAVKYMKKLISEGKLGQIFTYREIMGGHRIANPQVLLEWRMQEDLSGTGALADFGCHMIDLADYILKDAAGEMCEVSCMLNTFITERRIIGSTEKGLVTNDDSAVFSIRTEKGALLSFVASRLGTIGHTIEVYGSGGMMFFDQAKPHEITVMFKDVNGGYNNSKREILQVPEEYIIDPWFNAEINLFIDGILNGTKPQPDLERGLYIQRIIDTIKQSADQKTVIEL